MAAPHCSTARSTGSIPKSCTVGATIALIGGVQIRRASRFCSSMKRPCRTTRSSMTFPTTRSSSAGTIQRPATPIRQFGSVSSRRLQAVCAGSTPPSTQTSSSSAWAGHRTAARSSIRFKTARRRGSTSTAPTPGQATRGQFSGKRARHGSSGGRTRVSIRSG